MESDAQVWGGRPAGGGDPTPRSSGGGPGPADNAQVESPSPDEAFCLAAGLSHAETAEALDTEICFQVYSLPGPHRFAMILLAGIPAMRDRSTVPPHLLAAAFEKHFEARPDTRRTLGLADHLAYVVITLPVVTVILKAEPDHDYRKSSMAGISCITHRSSDIAADPDARGAELVSQQWLEFP